MNKRLIFVLIFTLLSFCSFAQKTEELVKTTTAFLSSLNKDELIKVQFEFEDSLRTMWTNLPVGIAKRPGLRYGDLSDSSKIQFQDILLTLLSSQGYLKANNIMHLDDYLLEIYQIAYDRGLVSDQDKAEIDTLQWGHGNYYIAVWGTPSNTGKWGMKFEGHHISLNVTVADGELVMTPLFLGSDPALVRVTQFAGMRALSKEEDYGLELINLLSEAQKTLTIISKDIPGDIITSPKGAQRLTDYQGIKGSDLTDEQKDQLKYIILEYIRNFEREQSKLFQDNIIANGVDDIYFGWIGGMERDSNHYYVINGPDFLIEYDNVGWIYGGDHIHTIFRDKKNDFGEDLLKKHYENHRH